MACMQSRENFYSWTLLPINVAKPTITTVITIYTLNMHSQLHAHKYAQRYCAALYIYVPIHVPLAQYQ